MSNAEINCTIYIASTSEKLWEALTDPDVTQRYWGDTRLESDWKVGSKLVFRANGKITDENTILENQPKKRLSYTFEPSHAAFVNEPASRVTFSIAYNDEVARLALVHDRFEQDSEVYKACSVAWPMILSSLKSLLETGKPLGNFDFC